MLQLFCLSVKAEYAEHGAKDLAIIYYDGIHGDVLRLETDMSLLLIEVLTVAESSIRATTISPLFAVFWT